MKNIYSLFCITSKVYVGHLQRLINLHLLENTNSVLIAPSQVKGHRSDDRTLHGTIARYFRTLTPHDSNRLSI